MKDITHITLLWDGKRQRISKSGLAAVVAMQQGDTPTLRELLYAIQDGLIEVTLKGEQAVRELRKVGAR